MVCSNRLTLRVEKCDTLQRRAIRQAHEEVAASVQLAIWGLMQRAGTLQSCAEPHEHTAASRTA